MAFPSNKTLFVSACLAGVNCTFRGKNNLNDKIKKLVDNRQAIALCPEELGAVSLSAPGALSGTPRESVELIGGDGNDLLDGRAQAISSSGRNVTENLIRGAREILKILEAYGIKEAVLKSNSPTCGAGRIYDGTFSGILIAGDGVLAALLKRNGIKVRTETKTRKEA
jgi:uncharacterized protein YbbK (DUF523 family)